MTVANGTVLLGLGRGDWTRTLMHYGLLQVPALSTGDVTGCMAAPHLPPS